MLKFSVPIIVLSLLIIAILKLSKPSNDYVFCYENITKSKKLNRISIDKYKITISSKLSRYNAVSSQEDDKLHVFMGESTYENSEEYSSDYRKDAKIKCTIDISEYESGIYDILLEIEGTKYQSYFVKNISPKQARGDILIIVPEYTFQAYNRYGERSFYTKNYQKGEKRTVSVYRPLENAAWYHQPSYNPIQFLRRNFKYIDVLSQIHLSENLNNYNLDKYKLIVIYGHDEYWPKNLRKKYDELILKNVNLLNISGNTGWWVIEVDKHLITRGKYFYETKYPEENLIGVSFRYMGYPVSRMLKGKFNDKEYEELRSLAFPANIPRKDVLKYTNALRVVNSEHPVFSGTGLKKHQFFGVQTKVVNVEVDGIWNTSLDSSITPLADGWAYRSKLHHGNMFVEKKHASGAKVLTIGTIGFLNGILQKDETLIKILKNSVSYLLESRS
jgi:hypothetical protein